MQVNQGNYTSYLNNASSVGVRVQDQAPQKPAAKPITREAIKAESAPGQVTDENMRGKLIAQNAYAGNPQRGGLLDIIV